jgi:metal-responsive CopG/Arc/MetJ family transcriptional regulator
MAKVNIYIPDDLLEMVDAEASDELRSRSSVVQEAVAEYLTASRKAQREEERQRRARNALAIADEIKASIAAEHPNPDITGAEFIRGLRDADDDATDEEIEALIRSRRPKGGRYVG